jgi:outer membrane protein assembly factor BamA
MLSRPLRTSLAALAMCGALSMPLAGQQFLPKKIAFSGTTLDQGALLAASGIKPGVTIGPPEIRAAAQKLLDTGLFSNVQYTFDGETLLYALTPATDLEPAVYANFPWWNFASLTAAIAAKVPLFHGAVPPESGLQQQVVGALTALLAEKGVQAQVTAVPMKEIATGATTGVEFAIVSPPVQVGDVTFSGVDPAFAGPVSAIEKTATGQDFGDATEATLAVALKAVYHRQGYLNESLAAFTHGQPQLSDGRVLVPITGTVVPGPQYRLGTMTIAGGAIVSPEDLAKLAELHSGDVANEDLLHGTLARISGAYKAHGYMNAQVQAQAALDRGTHTVNYAVTVEPGPLFHMGLLTLVGLNDEQRNDVLRIWPLHPGDVYNEIEVGTFLIRHRNELHSLGGWSASYRQYAHLDTNIVDLTVTFRQGGPLQQGER